MVTTSIETLTPDQVATMVANRHPRYESMWHESASRDFAKRIAKGFHPLAVIDAEGRLYDGALQMSGVPAHGEPVECFVVRYPKGESPSTRKWSGFPKDWEEQNHRICIENPTEWQINKLDEAQAKQNDGRGVQCVKDIVLYLRKDMYEEAKTVRRVDGDKTRMYPEVEYHLLLLFGCRSHGVHGCGKELCRSAYEQYFDPFIR